MRIVEADRDHRHARSDDRHHDAAAHGAETDDARCLDLPHRRVFGEAGNAGHFAFGGEDAAQRLGLRAAQRVLAHLQYELERLLEWRIIAEADRFERLQWRFLPALGAAELLLGFFKQSRIIGRHRQRPGAACAFAFGDETLGV